MPCGEPEIEFLRKTNSGKSHACGSRFCIARLHGYIDALGVRTATTGAPSLLPRVDRISDRSWRDGGELWQAAAQDLGGRSARAYGISAFVRRPRDGTDHHHAYASAGQCWGPHLGQPSTS